MLLRSKLTAVVSQLMATEECRAEVIFLGLQQRFSRELVFFFSFIFLSPRNVSGLSAHSTTIPLPVQDRLSSLAAGRWSGRELGFVEKQHFGTLLWHLGLVSSHFAFPATSLSRTRGKLSPKYLLRMAKDWTWAPRKPKTSSAGF